MPTEPIQLSCPWFDAHDAAVSQVVAALKDTLP
jgi:hypothetical protein